MESLEKGVLWCFLWRTRGTQSTKKNRILQKALKCQFLCLSPHYILVEALENEFLKQTSSSPPLTAVILQKE